MPKGTVTRVEAARGFGWIVDDAGMDWFFVRAGVAGGIETVASGSRVVFGYEWTGTGPRATDITLDRRQAG